MSGEPGRVLLVSAGVFHPPLFGRRALRAGLARLEGFSFRQVRSLEQIPADYDRLSALVLYYHSQTVSEAALSRLEAFVRRGGGILAIHSATASFKAEDRYFEILGGRFTGHGQVGNCVMKSARPERSEGIGEQIFGGIGNFTIKDELYRHALQEGVEIHYTAEIAGKEAPAVWTHHYGRGKVCYCMPGHTAGSMKHPAMGAILQRALAWVAER